jgi:ribose-phosphate pyrophosphokinase
MAAWIAAHVEAPLVVGPDSESLQWASRIAGLAGCPYVVLEKTRHGDRDVAISGAGLSKAAGRTPVLIDDIVSTAGTMIEAVLRLREANARPAVCVAVHGLFAGDAFERLQATGAAQIVTTNTVTHISNAIDVRPVLGEALRDLLRGSAD